MVHCCYVQSRCSEVDDDDDDGDGDDDDDDGDDDGEEFALERWP